MRIMDGGVGVTVPDPGDYAFASLYEVNGIEEVGVTLLSDFTARIYACGPDSGNDVSSLTADAGEVLDLGDGPTPTVDSIIDDLLSDDPENRKKGSQKTCGDGRYNLEDWHWTHYYDWHFNAGSAPPNVNQDNAELGILSGASNVTNAFNPCGLADNVDAGWNYQGRTDRPANATGNNCDMPDQYSVVDFGPLTGSSIGLACTYAHWYDLVNGGLATDESDIRLDSRSKWFMGTIIPADCQDRWSIEGVMTHEFGHAYGLAHVGEERHGNLTMSTDNNGTCQTSEETLGLGDVHGLEALY
ncbi:MAG: matrixin family metalloprotease [Actinomycetota bacterium]|nr:matrixin family metalloprotease [Actinomycetota bacterium]